MKIGYTCGVFDLLHIGHLNLLERCKEQCDYLIVGICNDKYVTDIKKKKPIYDEQEMLRLISALKCVDEAALVDIETTDDKMLAWDRFKFNVLFSGDDWKGTPRYIRTEEQFSQFGVNIVYLPYTTGISTTDIKNRIIESWIG